MKHLSVFFVAFILFIAVSCKKKAPPTLTSLHTKKLAKDWTWERQWFNWLKNQPERKGSYSDTVMPIKVITDEAIGFMGEVFCYYDGYGYHVEVDTQNKMVYVNPESGEHKIKYIEYYYHQDSVVYIYSTSSSGATLKTMYNSRH